MWCRRAARPFAFPLASRKVSDTGTGAISGPPKANSQSRRWSSGPDSAGYEQLASILGRLVPVLERSGLATAAELGIETMAQRLREEAIALGQCIVFPTLIGAWCRVARG